MNNKNNGISSEDLMNAAEFFDDDDEQLTKKPEKKDTDEINTSVEFSEDELKKIANLFDEEDEPVDGPIAEPIDEPVDKPIDIPIDEPIDKKNFDGKKIIAALRKVYLLDVLWRAGEAKNWGLIIWIVINMVLIVSVGSLLIIDSPVAGALIAAVVYIISIYIAVSPAGEFLLRHQNGCKKIANKKINERIMPIFNKVYSQAREKSPHISPKVQLFMCNEDSVNAFATGRKTVCITKGLLEMEDDHIEAILAHEFGHLANRDTDALLIVVVGNLVVTALMTILATVCKVFGFIIDHSDSGKGLNIGKNFAKIARFVLITAFMYVWTKLGALFCMRGNRKQEYAADNYAAELGNAQKLIDAFCAMDEAPAPKGLWATLVSTHPETADRIMKLNEYIDSKNVAISAGE